MDDVVVIEPHDTGGFVEVDDRFRLKPTVPFWRTLSRERRLSWLFDRRILPWVYWHLILKGRA